MWQIKTGSVLSQQATNCVYEILKCVRKSDTKIQSHDIADFSDKHQKQSLQSQVKNVPYVLLCWEYKCACRHKRLCPLDSLKEYKMPEREMTRVYKSKTKSTLDFDFQMEENEDARRMRQYQYQRDDIICFRNLIKVSH